MMSQPYKWLLKVEPEAQRQFDVLTQSTKLVIFRKLRDLLIADDPYSSPFVEMLQAKKFERFRKFRAGDYRVFFLIEAGAISHLGHIYKGKLYLIDVRNRKEAY